jgi:hypothetical protein
MIRLAAKQREHGSDHRPQMSCRPFDRLVGFYDFDQIHQVPRTPNLVPRSSRSFLSV